MVLQSQKTGCVWKTPFRKFGHIYIYIYIYIYSNDENPTEVQMCGKGEVFEADDEELLKINK